VSDSQRGAGSILAIGLLAAILACIALAIPLCSALIVRSRVVGAADASALAAADVAVGIVPGIPCAVAASLATANRARLQECQVDGVIVTVRVSTEIFGFPVAATATAGPADAVH